MLQPLKSPHRHLFLLVAALFASLSLVTWADNTTAPSATPPASPAAEPQVVPPGTPGAAPAPDLKQQPGIDLPDKGAIKQPQTPPATDDQSTKPAPDNNAPVQLPVLKPITVHADRDAEIEHEVGVLLEENHYLQTPITIEMSERWLKNYFDALDYNHLFFLQSDIDEFTTKYGTKLGDLLHGDNEEAAVAPAFEIFERYMQRVQENVKLSEKLLHENFDFTKDETFTLRNNKSPWLADAAASEAAWRGQVKSDLLNGVLEKKPTEDTIKRLSKRYASLLREGSEEEDLDVLSIYLSALTHAYDPHSDYFSPTEAANFNIQDIKHIVTGIGAVLKTDDGYATIEEIIAGGPADLDKRLQPGDKILAVGQGSSEPVDAVNMKLDHVVDMIRGPKGSMVHLVILPAGQAEGTVHKDIVLKRDMVSIKDSLAKAHIIEHPVPGGGTEKFGVINLQDFYEKTASDVAKLVQRLKKEQVQGIILDLRSNGGGLLDQAVDLTGLFVEREPVVQIRRFDNYTEQLSSDDTRQIYDGPLIVMVNKMSASATEIVAAALQDYGRAIIVGDESTHGKGTVQTLIPLDPQMPIGFPTDPGAGSLKMTVQKFYRVAGGSTQKKGVIPDIVLPSVLDALELGETTLPYYLPYDEVPKVTYDNLNLTAPYLPDLRTHSAARVAASPDFGYVRQDIAYYKKKVHDNTVSLNEATRLKEQADLKALNAQRKKDLEARKASRDTMLDLTLDMVAQNLPAAPPVVKPPKLDADGNEDNDDTPGLSAAVNHPIDDPQLDEAVDIMSDYTHMLRDSGSKLVQASPNAK
ncbi:MAG: carboxy terminal-processing peptidase [Methylacidiphilales bacterium]|nr:carboxy terminal-processing peptidase [Candidatus Methylacidiphilales bacterium]